MTAATPTSGTPTSGPTANPTGDMTETASATATDSSDGGQDETAAVDTEPPTVLSASPEEGATGVLADVQIVVTFSEAMDPATTEAAFSSEDFDVTAATFEWDGAGSTLTVTPREPLAYAQGADDDVVPLAYAFSISTDAQDLAGNGLLDPLSSSFETARHIQASLERVASLSGRIRDDGTVSTEFLSMGDDFDNGWSRGLLTFELDDLPSDVLEWNSAMLSAEQTSITCSGFSPDPYPDLGDLVAFDVTFNVLNVAATENAGLEIGVFSDSPALEVKSMDVSDEVEADVRAQRTQFLLRFDIDTDNDENRDCVAFDIETAMLAVDFLAE
ncbi:MAG: Ig-like domain-containing protein [Myxococcota bacterium]